MYCLSASRWTKRLSRRNLRISRKGKFTLTSNDTCQHGFRVAKTAGIDKVTSFDESNVGWDAQPMFACINEE